MTSVPGADVAAWRQPVAMFNSEYFLSVQFNPFSVCCDALRIAYNSVDPVRSAGPSNKLPKTRPDTNSAAPNTARAALAGGGG